METKRIKTDINPIVAEQIAALSKAVGHESLLRYYGMDEVKAASVYESYHSTDDSPTDDSRSYGVYMKARKNTGEGPRITVNAGTWRVKSVKLGPRFFDWILTTKEPVLNVLFDQCTGPIRLENMQRFPDLISIAIEQCGLPCDDQPMFQVVSIAARAFDKCEEFARLDILATGIADIDRDAFIGATRLETLVISECEYTFPRIDFSTCDMLDEIDLSHNWIKYLPKINARFLEVLNLSQNEDLKTIKAGTFEDASYLKKLHIAPHDVSILEDGLLTNNSADFFFIDVLATQPRAVRDRELKRLGKRVNHHF